MARRLLTDGVSDLLLDERLSTGAGSSASGLRAECLTSAPPENFGLSVEDVRFARLLLFVRGTLVQVTRSEPLADSGDGGRCDLDLLGDGGIYGRPAVLGLVGQKQNAGALAFPFGMALGIAQSPKLFARPR